MKLRVERVRQLGRRLRSRVHVAAMRLEGYAGSDRVHLSPGVRIPVPRRVTLGEGVHLAHGVVLECVQMPDAAEAGCIEIGPGVFVGEDTTIISCTRIEVGRNTMIAHRCSLTDANHGTRKGSPMRDQAASAQPIVIGEDCWLGTGVIVVAGVTIGPGTVVGAGSVVSKSLPGGVIAAGAPARVVRERTE